MNTIADALFNITLIVVVLFLLAGCATKQPISSPEYRTYKYLLSQFYSEADAKALSGYCADDVTEDSAPIVRLSVEIPK